MKDISDIKIVGIDERRPPRIRREPYIDLFFRLSHKAPPDWCQRFNSLLAKHAAKPKIEVDEGLFIETWVRTPEAIEGHLEMLKDKVVECSRAYIDNIVQQRARSAEDHQALGDETGEQGRLNRIIAELKFETE